MTEKNKAPIKNDPIDVRISVRYAEVCLEFPEPVQHIAFPPDAAIKIGELLISMAAATAGCMKEEK